jgi:hypothetical protein
MTRRGTIVYVHGASDRAAQVADHVARIEQQLAPAGMAFHVIPSRWGEAAGADLSRVELALPAVEVRAQARVPGMRPPGMQPMHELEHLAAMAAASQLSSDAAAAPRQADALLEVCRTQVGRPGESIQLADGSVERLAAACRNAANSVARSAEYAAARSSGVPEERLIDAVGRAVVATAAAAAASPVEVASRLEVRIAEAVLGAAVAAIFVGYLGIDLGPDLKRWATDVLIPHRARLLREAGLGPADVILYQRNPDAIRGNVIATLAEALQRGGPVVALGNSLGGVILVDALAQPMAPRPDLLVTVGSQAPLLATFGALHPLGGPGSASPFQPWLNIFDQRDLLGFVAGRVWPDQRGITDTEVDLGVGFPDSHGATYLSNPQVFRAIREHPALATNGARDREHRFRLLVGSLSSPARIVLGVRPDNSSVEVAGGIHIRMGRIAVEVPLGSADAWHTVDKAPRGRTLIGIVTALLGGVAALGSSEDKSVRVALRPPGRWVLFPLRALELAVEDPERLGRALSDHGINADASDSPSPH